MASKTKHLYDLILMAFICIIQSVKKEMFNDYTSKRIKTMLGKEVFLTIWIRKKILLYW